MDARVKATRRGGAVFRGAQQAKEGEYRGEEHDGVAGREVAVNARTQKDQGGNCDRSPRRPCEAVGLGGLEAAQHKPERMHTRHLRREAETEAEMLQPCQVRATWPRKGAYPGGPLTAPARTLGGGTGGGSPPPDRKPGTESALTRKPVRC